MTNKKLAIDGGEPVRPTLLPYARQLVEAADRDAVEAVLRSDWLTTGPMVSRFEQAVAAYAGAVEAVAVNTGTAALHAAMWALNVGPGDEVIVPAISFVATANCVLYAGAKPVFADLSPDTLNIAPEDIEKKITSRTRAIVAVDFAGHPCDHEALGEISERYGIPVVCDAAHSLGAVYRQRKVGVLQAITCLSFHPVKHITTGEGGMILTDDSALAKRIRSFRHHGIDLDLHHRAKLQSWQYDVVSLGYNYRIPDINCALGISQLTRLDSWLDRRRAIADAYRAGFSNIQEVELPTERGDCSSAWHLFVLRLNLDRLSVDRDRVFAALRAENIGVNVHYIPIPWLSYYSSLGYASGQWPVAESEFKRMLSLPMFPAMTDDDVADSITAVRKVLGNYAV